MDTHDSGWCITVRECPAVDRVGSVISITGEPVIIGRAGCACDVGLPDRRISRRHVEFSMADGALVCRDLDSTHGLFLNGERIRESRVLHNGDIVAAGSTQFEVKSISPPSEDLKSGHLESPADVQKMLARFYDEDAQNFKKMVSDEILSRMKMDGVSAADKTKNGKFRETVTHMLDTVLEERWYLAPIDLDREVLRRLLLDDLLEFGPITPLLRDDSISEVMINGPDRVFIERKGRLEATQCRFSGDAHVMLVIQRIVEPLGRRIDESSPRVDARLPDGSRVNAVIPPVALDGPAMTIRKFAKDTLSGDDLKRFGSVTQNMLTFLREVVESRQNVLISGGTGSGKTTLLNILSRFIPMGERIVTIEDSAELQLTHLNLVRMEARPPNMEGKGEVTIRDLVINALRMRPDRIVVGECRGKEAFDMLQAMNTGHDGSLTTIHANSPRDALLRLENMVMMAGFDLPVVAIREHIASAINIVVQQTRMADGSRKITRISEVTGREDDVITMQDIFLFKQTGIVREGERVRVEGYYEATGNIPVFLEALRQTGMLNIDLSIFSITRSG